MDTPQIIESLEAQIKPVEATDLMAEAGRKVLLTDFVKMLQHEAGSRVGEDPEEVHDMRVSIRRIRSILRLLAAYYKPKAIDPLLEEMQKIAAALGTVRDLDVLIIDVSAYAEKAENGAAIQPVIDELKKQNEQARKALIKRLDKGSYKRFVEEFSEFLSKPGAGARAVDLDDLRPTQVRHLLPPMIYEHLGAVRAYDAVLAEANALTLHELRIEFKRLRYVVSVFSEVLGSSAGDFTDELKKIQDHLGRIADIRAAKDTLKDAADGLEPAAQEALQTYLDAQDAEQDKLRESFGDVWRRFNTKTVQRNLGNAVSGL
jgi:CHAD domain-containing protein